ASAPSSPVKPSALWTVPYRRNPHFTGRDEQLASLAGQLSLEKRGNGVLCQADFNQPLALRGLGGIGKTQIALEYAFRSRERGDYTHILWFNTASKEAIIASFLTLAALLPDVADPKETNQQQLIAAILRWLEQCQEPWLLIFDNVDDLSLVQPYIPTQSQGSVLLTTRATAVAWLANSLEVEQMGLMEGTQLLLHRAQRLDSTDEECNEATNVVMALDSFPLALDQAGAYIEETGCGFGDYLQLYEQRRTTLLARRGHQATNYPDSVATTWSLSLQKVEQSYPAAAILLQLCAYLSPDHIPEELFINGAEYWPPTLQQAVTDRFSVNEMLEVLLSFSLVKRLAQERLLSLHRLVQIVQMDQMDPEEQYRWAERVVCAVNELFPADPREPVEAWPLCLRYLEQVQACDTLIQQYHLQLPEAALVLDRAGAYLQEHASYNLAELLFRHALTIAEQHWGGEHIQVASPLCNLGQLYSQQGQYEQAEPLLRRALHIQEQGLDALDPLLATTHNYLGILYRQQGQYEQAEYSYRQALHIREQALGPDHPLLASPLTNLGTLCYEQGKYEQSELFYQQALRIRERALGPDHVYVAFPLANLGAFYVGQGRYEQAEPLLRRALQIREQALNPLHPLLATSLTGMGIFYAEQGQYEQAEALYRRALHILEQVLGLQHPQVGELLNALANVLRGQGHYEQAEQLYQRALSIRQQLGPQHPDQAETLGDLAHLYHLQRHNTQALAFYQRSLNHYQQIYAQEHPKVRDIQKALQQIIEDMNLKTENDRNKK
ncbi:MAG TPA: FxSxx-COOH system tetratricopeptide repeat protein, partial [Ktedonobacteraceae bacterium]|nr:FxSxx-COOH system tetratricopeptide repeat protein [Ktedonobacteraceae bacterium]